MDIYSCINSKDIRTYLKEINYEFTPVEAAWLIWQCESIALTEKHTLWQEIIDTMPDMPIENRNKTLPSLHQFLKDYMQFEMKIIDRFYSPREYCIFQYKSRGEDYEYECKKIFKDFVSCYEDALKDAENEKNVKTVITMKDTQNSVIEILFTAKSLEINENNLAAIINDGKLSDEESETAIVFKDMWFVFPVPFKKGDIVVKAQPPYGFYGCYDEPFVLTKTVYDDYKETGKRLYDYTDMYAAGYFQDRYEDSGKLCGDIEINYMNLEYYTGELTGNKRALKALSNHLKGKIDVMLFANAYHQILTKAYLDRIDESWQWTKEYRTLAGLEEEGNEYE